MIFVTVGTHEQQFDRLIKKVDQLKKDGFIKEEVFIQTGYSIYVPQACEYAKLISYKEMNRMINEASIIVTHGGPGSIMIPLSLGKVPIVVPRQSKYDEHVDDHQVLFCKRLEQEKKVLAVYDINDLQDYIVNYDFHTQRNISININSDLDNFIERLKKISIDLVGERKFYNK